MRRYQSDSDTPQDSGKSCSLPDEVRCGWPIVVMRGLFCRLSDLLLVEVTSCIDDFFVGRTTCSAVGHVVVLVTLRFPPPLQTATNALSFFSTV